MKVVSPLFKNNISFESLVNYFSICFFFYYKEIVIVALVALVAAQQEKEPVAIVSSNSEMNADGSYTYK